MTTTPLLSPRYHARFFFVLYAVVGLVSPYLGVWLHSVVPGPDFKIILTGFYLTIIVVPTVWGHLAFAGGDPGQWLNRGALVAAAFALGLTQVAATNSMGANIVLLMLFGALFNPLLPLLDAIAYNQLASPQAYARVRLYGSIGFMACSFLIGGVVVLEHPATFPYVVALALVLAWVASRRYVRAPAPAQRPRPRLRVVDPTVPRPIPSAGPSLRRTLWSLAPVWWVAGTSQAAFACYYTFFAMAMTERGVPGWLAGLALAMATASEVLAFRSAGWFFRRASPWALIAIASLATTGRWVSLSGTLGFSLTVVLALQITQALGFSIVHTSCMSLIRRKAPDAHMGAAQGVYNAVGYGVGGVVGVFLGGVVWERYHHATGLFLLAAALSLAAGLGALLFWGWDRWRGARNGGTALRPLPETVDAVASEDTAPGSEVVHRASA